MPRVAVFSTNFLAFSQTFVHDEVVNHVDYEVEVFCRRRLLEDRFPFAPVHVGGLRHALRLSTERFERVFRERPFDLVHAHFGTGACYAAPYARRHGLPLVVTFHGYEVPLLRDPSRFLPWNLPYAAFAADMLESLTLGLCASRELLEMLAAWGVPRAKLRLYHLGVDLERFQPGARRDPPAVLMVGRFVEKKGFDDGIRAFAWACARGARGDLTVVGDGPLGRRLRSLAAQLGVSERVHFTGALSPTDVARLMSASDVLLAPSVVGPAGDRESGLLVVKEASACHAVPVGTRHGGIPEIIDDGVTGFLVDERDFRTMGERLLYLLADPAARARMGRAGRAKMEAEYDLRRQVRQLEGFYDEARRLHAGGSLEVAARGGDTARAPEGPARSREPLAGAQ